MSIFQENPSTPTISTVRLCLKLVFWGRVCRWSSTILILEISTSFRGMVGPTTQANSRSQCLSILRCLLIRRTSLKIFIFSRVHKNHNLAWSSHRAKSKSHLSWCRLRGRRICPHLELAANHQISMPGAKKALKNLLVSKEPLSMRSRSKSH